MFRIKAVVKHEADSVCPVQSPPPKCFAISEINLRQAKPPELLQFCVFPNLLFPGHISQKFFVICMECHCRRVLGWWLDLLYTLIQHVTTLTVHYCIHAVAYSHVFTSRCSVAASNGGRFPSSGFPNCPPPPLSCQLLTGTAHRLDPSGPLTDCISQSKLCYGRRSLCHSVLMWSTHSDERMGLSFTVAAGPRQRSYSPVRVPRDSWPHLTLSDSRLPKPGGPGPCIYTPPGTGLSSYTPRHWVTFSSPPKTRRATVEVFEPASTRGTSPSNGSACHSVHIFEYSLK
jgi:hypothetical protein